MGYDSSLSGIASMVAVLLFLTSGTLILRLTARSKQKTRFGIDDVLAAIAWLMFLGSNIVAIYGRLIFFCCPWLLTDIMARFTGFSTPSDKAFVLATRQASTQAYTAGFICAIVTLGFARLSAILFFRRIFCTGTWSTFDIITKVLIGIVSSWMVCFFFMTVFICGSNLAILWSFKNIETCLVFQVQKGVAVSSFILDFIILVLPLPKIWQLHTTPARKIAISAVFLMALSALVASCLRMLMLFSIVGLGATANRLDPFESNTRNYFYQLLEQGACVTAVNLPSIWYFFHGLTPKKFLRSVRSLISLRSAGSQESVTEKNSLKTPQSGSMDSTNRETMPSKRAHLEYVTETQASD